MAKEKPGFETCFSTKKKIDYVKRQMHVLAAQYTTVTNLVTIYYTVLVMTVHIARSYGEVRSFGNFLHSHQSLSPIVVNCGGLLKKCGATWLHNRCVWTGNKLPDPTKIQVKFEATATAVRQRKCEFSMRCCPYSSVGICSLLQ